MKVYVGRWSLLPDEWEGINGLYEKSTEEIEAEVKRQQDFILLYTGEEDPYVGVYTIEEFEEEFNADNDAKLHGLKYWIKIR